MILIGVVLLAVAIITFMASKPRHGVIRIADHPILEVVAGLVVTAGGVMGIIVTLVGLMRP